MSWIDLLGKVTFTETQLEKRYDAHIQSKFPLHIERAMNRRAMGKLKGKYTPTDKELFQEKAYEQLCKDIRLDFDQATNDNALLIETLDYEQAVIRLSWFILSEGRKAVKEILEVINPETGEITQEYVPGILGIDPRPIQIEMVTHNEDGNPTETIWIDNPKVVRDIIERNNAQNIIDNVTSEMLALIVARK